MCDQALPSGSGGDTADQMQKMMCAANIRKNHAYVKARSLIAALYSLRTPCGTRLLGMLRGGGTALVDAANRGACSMGREAWPSMHTQCSCREVPR